MFIWIKKKYVFLTQNKSEGDFDAGKIDEADSIPVSYFDITNALEITFYYVEQHRYTTN